MLSDCSKFFKIEFSSKHAVNQDIRHLPNLELEIKSCLTDLLPRRNTNIWKYVVVNQELYMDFVKFTKVPQLMLPYLLFDWFHQQLVLLTTALQICFYQYLKSLLLMNTPSKIIFHFVKKLLTKTKFLGHLSIFSYCLQIYPWIKQLIFAFI